MMDLKFLLRVIMLEDTMAAAMALSLKFQTVNVLAWDNDRHIRGVATAGNYDMAIFWPVWGLYWEFY